MADPRFFCNAGPITLAALAEMTGATLSDPAQRDKAFVDVAPLDRAGAEHLSFFDNIKYKDQFTASRAGACFATPEAAQLAPQGMVVLVSERPYRAYALAAQAFYPDPQIAESEISPHAFVAPDAVMGDAVKIDDGAVIGAGAVIGTGCHIGPHTVIGAGVVLGEQCWVGAQASLSHCVVGRNVRIYPGVRIGQDGFGFAIDPAGHVKVPQLGRVVIGDNVEIGANTCIDRGAGPDTEIGDGAWIDNLVQIGHNVKIGRGCVIVSQVGISGSTVVEDYAVLAGQAGVAGHLRIGKGARVAAQAGIMRDVPPGAEVMGYPAVPLRQFMKQIAYLNKIVSKKKE